MIFNGSIALTGAENAEDHPATAVQQSTAHARLLADKAAPDRVLFCRWLCHLVVGFLDSVGLVMARVLEWLCVRAAVCRDVRAVDEVLLRIASTHNTLA